MGIIMNGIKCICKINLQKDDKFPVLVYMSPTDWIIVNKDGSIEAPTVDGYWTSSADIYQGTEEVAEMIKDRVENYNSGEKND